MQIEIERRKNPRAPVDTEARVGIGTEEFTARIIDLAAKGIALSCPFQWQVGRSVRIEFLLRTEQAHISCRATLVRQVVADGICLWGLRFNNLDNIYRAWIEQHVREHLMSEAKKKYQGRLNARYAQGAARLPRKRGEMSPNANDSGKVRRLFRAALKHMGD